MATIAFHGPTSTGSGARGAPCLRAPCADGGSSQHLERHQTLWLRTRAGTRIACDAGCVWVTRDGDERDVILQAGDAVSFDAAARAGVHALEGAQVRYFGLDARGWLWRRLLDRLVGRLP